MSRSDAAGAVGWRRGRQGASPRRTPTTPPDDPCSVNPHNGKHDEALTTALVAAGLRPTRMRIGVLGLARDARVLTPELVLRRLPDIRPGSIYRVLAEFHGKGLLKRYLMRNGRCLYTAIDLAHGVVILHCSGCGHACCLDSSEIVRRLDQVAASCGYMVERGLLELGACRRCSDSWSHDPAGKTKWSKARLTDPSSIDETKSHSDFLLNFSPSGKVSKKTLRNSVLKIILVSKVDAAVAVSTLS